MCFHFPAVLDGQKKILKRVFTHKRRDGRRNQKQPSVKNLTEFTISFKVFHRTVAIGRTVLELESEGLALLPKFPDGTSFARLGMFIQNRNINVYVDSDEFEEIDDFAVRYDEINDRYYRTNFPPTPDASAAPSSPPNAGGANVV